MAFQYVLFCMMVHTKQVQTKYLVRMMFHCEHEKALRSLAACSVFEFTLSELDLINLKLSFIKTL